MKKFFRKFYRLNQLWYIVVIFIFLGLVLFSSNIFRNLEITKLWLNFIQKILSIFISWPVAVVIISLKFRDSIVQLIMRINRLKIGDNELNFAEKLQEVKKGLDAEESTSQGEEDNETVSEEYVELASIEPQMAILRSWLDYEKLLRDKFNQLVEEGKIGYDFRKRFISASEMMFQLSKNGLINKNMYGFSKELNLLRNSIVHGQEVYVSTEMALEYNRTLDKLKKIIEEI